MVGWLLLRGDQADEREEELPGLMPQEARERRCSRARLEGTGMGMGVGAGAGTPLALSVSTATMTPDRQ